MQTGQLCSDFGTGGLVDLCAHTGAQVYGPALEVLPVNCTGLKEGDLFSWHGLDWHVIDVPGHTAGHIAWVGQPAEHAPLLFCGDTLFSAGCGRLFEGTPEALVADETVRRVYLGEDFTL